MGAELWKQIEPETDERGRILNDIAFDRLSQGRWSVAEGLSTFVMKDKKSAEALQLVGLLNYWQSLKWQDRFDAVANEVKQADFSAKDELFQVGRLALLDDFDGFFKLVPKVLKSEKLDSTKLSTWPIFREIRKTPEYTTLVREQGWDRAETDPTVPKLGDLLIDAPNDDGAHPEEQRDPSKRVN